ncbi:MAG: tripartite tricarboxylate transporter TctB family protein [Candidatus Accumulibacter sp.]|jgi:hypothetical protein|nr:tripartite tricarboxylate transporter TctB family protein [Accumulibacter sp.]
MTAIRNPRDFWGGILFMGFGAVALYFSQPYSVGVASRMGPGYFPRALGILLVSLGALLSLLSFRSSRESKIAWRWRPLLVVLLSVCIFPWVMEVLGLIVTSVLLVFISSMAGDEFRWKEALISGVILGIAATAVFVHGLAIPLPVWPSLPGGGA